MPGKHLAWLCGGVLACLLPVPYLSLVGALILVLWLPGDLLVAVLRPLGGAACRFCRAVAASLVLMPVWLNSSWHISNRPSAVLGAVVAMNLLLLMLAHRGAVGCEKGFSHQRNGPSGASHKVRLARFFRLNRRQPFFASSRTGWLLGGMVVWIGACVFGSYWIPSAGGRTATPAAHDSIKHHAVMLSLERHPLPLHNMFYTGEPLTAYYYYHYHYLLPSAVRKLAGDGVSIPFAFGLTAAVTAGVFISLVFALTRDLTRSENGALLAALCASIVGGWDIVPVLLRVLAGEGMVVTLDAWAPVHWRIHNLATQYSWCPQHVAAMVAFLLGCHWLQRAPSAAWWVIIGPLLAASIFGSSTYLAVTLLLPAGLYVLLRLLGELRRGWRPDRRSMALLAAGIGLCIMLIAPQAWGYQEMSRRFGSVLTLQWPRFPYAVFGRLLPPGPLANLLDAPWLILVEFGLPAVALAMMTRARWRTLWHFPSSQLLIMSGLLGILLMFTIRSDVNVIDYGFRLAVIPAMTLATICVGMLVQRAQRKARAVSAAGSGAAAPDRRRFPLLYWSIAIGVLLGLPVGLYEAPLMAARSLIESDPNRQDAGAIRFLRMETPPDAVVQGHPRHRVRLPQLIDRRTGVLNPDDPHVNVFRPVDRPGMLQAFREMEAAFETGDAGSAYETLRSARVTHVLAGGMERRNGRPLAQFLDERRFEVLYDDGLSTVYRLVAGDPDPGSPAE